MQAKQITREIGTRRLWFGIFAAPIAWAFQLFADFSLPESIVCTPGWRGTRIFGADVLNVIQIINLAAAVVTVAGFAIALRCYLTLRRGDHSVAMRAHWMAIAGLFNSVIFGFLVLSKFLSPALLSQCGRSP